ncbi:MAG TPA: aminotransferase class V-fold PLP-dependent enzyme [Steroidobacteraceae bacterium]|nr:aminotransferase class V-fold PLP-dependent enzyme [Steroidobacteraceae bacterium]
MTIYLDYAATTPVDPRVAEAMVAVLASGETQGNAASATHGAGLQALQIVETGRSAVARLVGAPAPQIIFTSGATEANNLAILGVAAAARRSAGALPAGERKRPHFVSARTEHKSVLDTLKELERQGAYVTWLEPDEWGRIPPDAVRTALRDETLLVSVMHANNELGCINDITGIAAACRERGVLLHVDASQSAGKIPCDVTVLGVDLMSFTAHKMHGPKGIGALYVRESARPRIAPIMFGGGHERGLRSGTLATHQIMGFAEASAICAGQLADDARHAHALRARLTRGLEGIPGVIFNTRPGEESLPGILNVSFEGVEGESLVTALDDLAVSTGSACSSATREPSYVLRALGRDAELAQSSLRLSFGRFTTEADIDLAVGAIRRELSRLRVIAGGQGVPGAPLEPSVAHRMPGYASPLNGLGQIHFRRAPRPPEHPEGGALPTGIRQGRAGRRSDGAEVLFELEIVDGFVKSARFSAYGCPHTLAVSAWLCEVLEGSRVEAGPPGTPAEWAERHQVPAEKLGRMLIVEDALRGAFAG